MAESDFKANVRREADRIIEDALHSSKAHYNAALRWSSMHLWVGVLTTLMAALAGGFALSEISDGKLVAGILSLVAAALSACTTFIKPQDRASSHQVAGSRYISLRNDTRLFSELALPTLQEDEALKRIEELNARRSSLAEQSPQIPKWAYQKALEGIARGEADYRVDTSIS